MDSNRYRVLHIFSGFGGGISSLILNLVENKTDDFIFDVLAFSYEGGKSFVDRLAKKGTTCYEMPRPKQKGHIAFIKYLDRLLSQNNYDAVHCHLLSWKTLIFELLAKKHHIKTFIIHAHTARYDSKISRNELVRRINQFNFYHFATDYLTCSDLAASYIFGSKYLRKREALLIPNGVNETLLPGEITESEKRQYRKEFCLPNDSKTVIHIGRFSNQKNHPFIVDIIDNVNKDPTLFFLLVGDGELRGRIQKDVSEKGLDSHVRFLGRREDVFKLIQFSDIMILPSLYEGLPTVAIECQAAGTSILIADTVTRQCDMGLGLVEFLPLTDVKVWIDAIYKTRIHKVMGQCLDAIRTNSFTAQNAGIKYCEFLKEAIYGKLSQNDKR